MDNNLNEKVARFIARFRTVVVESSLAKIDEAIAYDDAHKTRLGVANELRLLRETKQDSDIIRTADEETRYQELLAQNVLDQLLAIQGVESVDVVVEDGVESLQVTLQAYYLHRGVFYDAGRWIWSVDMVSADDNIFNIERNWYSQYALIDGTCFPTGSVLFSGKPCERFKNGRTEHPYYPDDYYGFCFGDSSMDIRAYLLTGEFVSAFQLVSLCLHYVNIEHRGDTSRYFNVAYDVDVRELAEYFGLSDAKIAQIEAKHQALRQSETKTSTPEQPATPPDSDAD